MNLLSTCLFLFALAVAGAPACAQTFPTKPIRLVIGSYPGGGIDLAGRIIAQKMSENLRQQVIVDNRGGANGIIGMDSVAKSAPDGYTFYMGTAGHISVNPVIHAKLPFNVDRDFTPLTAGGVAAVSRLSPSVAADQDDGRADRPRESESRHAHVVFERRRRSSASRRRAGEARERHRHAPHSLQGQRACFQRSAGRPGAILHRGGVDRPSAREGRQAGCPGDDGTAAPGDTAERSDAERNAAGRGGRELVRRAVAEGRLERDRQSPPRARS